MIVSFITAGARRSVTDQPIVSYILQHAILSMSPNNFHGSSVQLAIMHMAFWVTETHADFSFHA
jgi:hypothetical protein